MEMAEPKTALVNLKAALEAWKNVLPEEVDPDLRCYRVDRNCGTTACLAGWLPAFPHFQALGVTAEPETGAPTKSGKFFIVFVPPEELFGQHGGRLYHVRGYDELPGYTDHEVVTARLEEAIRLTEAELSE